MVDAIQQPTANDDQLKQKRLSTKRLYIDNDRWQELDIDLKRSSGNRFGFGIIGGDEYLIPIRIGSIERGDLADRDGRLKLYDVILSVNNISFTNISREAATRVLKSSGKNITMRIQRFVPCLIQEIQLDSSTDARKVSVAADKSNVTTRSNSASNNAKKIGASSNADNPLQQLQTDKPHRIKNSAIPTSNSPRNSIRNNAPVRTYEVGTYEDLKRRLLRRIDLDICHLIPTNVAVAVIPDYKESEAVCIALDISKNYREQIITSTEFTSLLFNYDPKKIIAYCIGFHTRARLIPTPVLVEAIRFYCEKYPHVYKTACSSSVSSQKPGSMTYGIKELIRRLPFYDPSFIGEAPDVVKYGNCIKDISVQIRVLLEQNGTIELGSWENGNYSGTYILHRDTDPLTDQPRILRVFIKLYGTETRREETDEAITTYTTYSHRIAFNYE